MCMTAQNRTMSDTAAPLMRCPLLTLTGAPRALLLERLLAGAGNFGNALCLVRAGPARRQLIPHHALQKICAR